MSGYKTELTDAQMRYGDPEQAREPHRSMLIQMYREREAEDALFSVFDPTAEEFEGPVGWEAPNGCVVSAVLTTLSCPPGLVIEWSHPVELADWR